MINDIIEKIIKERKEEYGLIRDMMIGYMIKALREEKYKDEEITKILTKINELENKIKPNQATGELYGFTPKEKED